MSRIAPALVGVALLGAAVPAHAGGFHISIFGGRRTGMLANLGAPDDATALFHNPAGLADQRGWRLHASGSVAFLNTAFTLQALDSERFPEIDEDEWSVDSEGYYRRQIEPLSTFGVLPYLGVTKDLGEHNPTLDGLTISAAVTAPNLYGANLPSDAPTSYFFIEGYFVTISPMLGFGYRVNDWLAVGGNASYNYLQLKYSQKFAMADLLRGANPTPADEGTADLAQAGLGDVRLDYTGADHGFGWTLSALITPTDWMSIGLAYAGATTARFEGDVRIGPTRAGVSKQLLDESVTLFGFKLPQRLIVEMPIPPALQAGVMFKLTDWLEMGVDYRLWLYNVFEEQVMIPIYDDSVEGDPPITREDLTKDKDYGVSYEIGGGALVRPWNAYRELEVMAGVGFDKSPVPDKTFSIDNPSMDQLVLTAGVRWFADAGVRASATYMFLKYLERDVRNSIGSPPLNSRGSGHNHMPRLEIEYLF